MVDTFLGGFDGFVQGFLGNRDPELAPEGVHTVDPYSLIGALGRVDMQEKVSATEALSAALGQEVEMANKYKVMAGDKQVFFAYEGTGFCQRQCQGGLCCWFPAWETHLRVVTPAGIAEEAFLLQRPWSCTCCCFGRPRVVVTDVRSGLEIAQVTDPYACCNLTFNIHDENEEERINAEAFGCQPGLCCPCPCGPCARVEFAVQDARSGESVGQLTKQVPGILSFIAAPDVDNYAIDFSGVQDPKLKIALLATAIFIDFRFFNNNSNDDDAREDARDQFGGSSSSE